MYNFFFSVSFGVVFSHIYYSIHPSGHGVKQTPGMKKAETEKKIARQRRKNPTEEKIYIVFEKKNQKQQQQKHTNNTHFYY